MASALQDEGVVEVWGVVEDFVKAMKKEDEFGLRRKLQRKLWMWNHIDWKLVQRYEQISNAIIVYCTDHH